MVAGGANSIAEATKSTAIGTNVRISSSAENAVAVSAYIWKDCKTTEPGSLKLCAEKDVTIEGSALVVNGNSWGSALTVNGVDVLKTTQDLKWALAETKAELDKTKTELHRQIPYTNGELDNLKANLLNTTGELANLKVKTKDELATKAELLNTKAELLKTKDELADLRVKTKDELATKAELLNTKAELADLIAKVAALTALKSQTQTSPASVSLVGTLLALSLTAAAVA
jgi:hypothetical protein